MWMIGFNWRQTGKPSLKLRERRRVVCAP